MATASKTTIELLAQVQQELKVPKAQDNNFAHYKFRSTEDILTAVKPLLNKHDLTITLSDRLEYIGDRYYVRAEVTVFARGGDPVVVTAYAREEFDKKGFDAAQITGSASSYARKYALSGMFAIDDTKDADNEDNRTHVTKTQPKANTDAPTNNMLADLVKVTKALDLNENNTADFFQDAIGKPRPQTKADFIQAVEFGKTVIADRAEHPDLSRGAGDPDAHGYPNDV